jgi:calmodulin
LQSVNSPKQLYFQFQELTSLLRSMGQNPTDAEVHDMINQVDVDGSGVVEFEEFCQFVKRLMKNMNPENEVREAYRR